MLRRTLVLFVLSTAIAAFAVWAVPAAAMHLAAPSSEGDGAATPSAVGLLSSLAQAEPEGKIEGALRDKATDPGLDRLPDPVPDREHDLGLDRLPDPVPVLVPVRGGETYVVVQSVDALDLAPYSDFVHQFTWPAGEHVAVARVRTADVVDIAGLPGVFAVDSGDPATLVGQDPLFGGVGDADAAEASAMRRRMDAAPAWSDPAGDQSDAGGHVAAERGSTADRVDAGGEPRPDDWWEVEEGHQAREAWAMGVRGDGVTVAVLDNAVDFSHPDLQETWRVLPEGNPYYGWAQVFDPYSSYLRVVDADLPEDGVPSTRSASSGIIELYQTAGVTETEIAGSAAFTTCLQPLVFVSNEEPKVLRDATCDYVVPGTSKSGQVRFGHHPDSVLMGNGAKPDEGTAGEWAGVLLVDEAEAGRYDTVYVDINGDRDFTDEKPTTKDDPLALRDMDGDDIADRTGGLLYWISDGEKPFPASWVWGLGLDVPPAGRLIGFLYAAGDHGTMCASNIVSQGRLGVPDDQRLDFRDLPGDGRPPSVNLGLAPDSALVSIGTVYQEPSTLIFRASWRYSVFGHDLTSEDDDIQITSNSYAFSATDNDGWDADSRLLDYYIRTFAENQSFLTGTGNGGPGYGTNLPPIPSVGMGIAASTQMGSTGQESITDTAQITFGDITPFSNRGPGADGRAGPSLAANGNTGAGAYPINLSSDGAHSNVPWGGTSRSGPVAAGAMALVYDGFHSVHGEWPSWEQARSILMSGSRFAGYDVFTSGAGVVDVGDSVRIAVGEYGVHAVPSEWTAGGFRGTTYPAFANLLAPGAEDTTAITLHNPAEEPLTVTLSSGALRRIGTTEDSIVTNRLEQSEPSTVPDYVKAIDKSEVPEGTELMIARARYPMNEFDVDGDYGADNVVGLGVLQHTDVNGDGVLWHDDDGNDVVNHRQLTDSAVQTLDGEDWGQELNALESGIAAPLEEMIEDELVWYGRACDGDPVFGDPTGKLALIARGTCYFSMKLLNAQNAGAIGVIMYTDNRAKTSMGGDSTGIRIPAVMIDNEPGLALTQRLVDGETVQARMWVRDFIGQGIDGAGPVVYEDTELDQYEFMRLSADTYQRNHRLVSVHHPLERWSDGLHVGLWNVVHSPAVTNTHVSLRYDYYAHQDWDWVDLSEQSITIPAGGEVVVEATLAVPEDAPYGAYQGAIFVDYERLPGDEPVHPPAGYELPHLRTVIPVNANVAATYDWQGSVSFGGPGADDPDAPYSNGTVLGAFQWDWRPESGDWRFFFVDALTEPLESTYWLFRSTWEDSAEQQSDVDTRVYHPTADRYSDPYHPGNIAEDRSDPDWYGPYTLDYLIRSPYLVSGSTWPFQTSSGGNEDWLIAPAGEGLHEVMLHNVLFSGSQFEMPFETTVSSIDVSRTFIPIVNEECVPLSITPQMDLTGFSAVGYGPSPLESIDDVPAVQDNPDDFSSASFKHDLSYEQDGARLTVTVDADRSDVLLLLVLRDADDDGEFVYPDELVDWAQSGAAEAVVNVTDPPAGAYQIWVHGYAVSEEDTTFDLTIDALTIGPLFVKGAPEDISAGETIDMEVCVDTSRMEGLYGPVAGLVALGPEGAPGLIQILAAWQRFPEIIHLPMALKNAETR